MGLIDRRMFALGAGAAALALPSLAHAQRRRLLERRESQYNTIYVVEDGQYIAMLFGVNQQLFTESLYNPADPRELPVIYTRYMSCALAYTPEHASLLEIGLGGGRTAHYLHLHMPQTRITCVELDPEVIALAERYFGITPDERLRVEQSDGRIYLQRSREQYDLIMVDAYRGTFVPFHLLTREFFQLAKRRLRPGGAVAQNIEPSTMLYDAAIATLMDVFEHVDVYPADGNVVAVAYDGPAKTEDALNRRARALQTQYRFRHPLPPLMEARAVARRPAGARVLTDDFAPVESLRAIDRHNARQ